jgi:uncharacterized protein
MRRPRRVARRPVLLAFALLLLPAASAWTQPTSGEPEIPPAIGFVNDRAGVMDETTRARLEAFLDQVKTKTGAEFAVLTVDSTAPLLPSEYKVQVFQRWGLGQKHEDNGLLLLVAMKEREAWFETGYGLEGALPDGLQARIVREQMSPRFRAGDVSGCIVAGVTTAAARIAAEKGVTLEWDGRELRYSGGSESGRLPPWVAPLIFFLLLILFSRLRGFGGYRRRGLWGGPWMGGGFGGWGGGWGGGFGGGGGGSFGGFGGGASGGGGGGGHL